MLPCAECKGRCCSYPAFSQSEFDAVKSSFGIPKGTTVRPITFVQQYDVKLNGTQAYMLFIPGGRCPYLKDGKCSIYYLRPKVCRDYGVVEDLPCEYLYPELAKQKQDARIAKTPGGKVEPVREY